MLTWHRLHRLRQALQGAAVTATAEPSARTTPIAAATFSSTFSSTTGTTYFTAPITATA